MRDEISLRAQLQPQQRDYVEGFFFFNSAANILLLAAEPTAVPGFGRLTGLFTPCGCISVVCFYYAPPWSSPFSASACGLPPASLHLHRQPGTPKLALTSEGIADRVAVAACSRRPPDPTSARLELLHGRFECLSLQMALP